MLFQIRLIRTSEHINDDVVTIRNRRNRSDYILKYVDGLCPRTSWISERSKAEVLDYVEKVLFFFKVETVTFKAIQLTPPGRPSIYVAHSFFTEEMCDNFMEILNDCLTIPMQVFTQ